MVGRKLVVDEKITNWLTALLSFTFFDSCDFHGDYRKNERNLFCIDCGVGFCRHCVKSHCLHRRLQICKYVYHNVVRVQEMQKHLDCSKIQTYKINGEKAVHLNPRPQAKDAKASTKSFCASSCEACGRYIQDFPNQFCSIACKNSVVPLRPRDQTRDFATIQTQQYEDVMFSNSDTNPSEMESSLSVTESSEDLQPSWANSALKPRKHLRKRKGVPSRAPFQ